MELLILVIGLLVGGLGAMLGIGGGVLLVPLLTGIFGIPIKTAIGASIISVIATSSAAGAVYVSQGFSHTRLSLILEIATTLGALAGGLTAMLLSPQLLQAIFGLVLAYVVYSMRRRPREEQPTQPTGRLDGGYTDPASGKFIQYGIQNLPVGMGASFLAGNVSGLLGIGGGIIKVPIMNLVMRMPLRAAIATSNFMIGVTAATSAVIYYQHGFIDPRIAIPTALGVLIGAQVGSRIGGQTRTATLRQIFQVLLLLLSAQMLFQAVAP